MTVSVPQSAPKTIADWLAQPEDARFELIDGAFVEKPAPTIGHARAQSAFCQFIQGPFDRKPGGPNGPGGWWIGSEVDVALDGRGYRPDIAGWRRERMPVLPRERPVTVRPDWVCEILSESNRATDTITKLRRFHQSGIPHYWILDPVERTLTVHRHNEAGYVIALRAEADERVRAEPFEAVELHVGLLLGDDPE
jgi:Uma2 family endonuclease